MSISREVLARYITPSTYFCETGTRWGDTVIKAVELGALRVSSCEADFLQHAMAFAHLTDALPRADNWYVRHGKSVEFLLEYGPFYPACPPVTIFLDAHTERESPLIDEIRVISEFKRPMPKLTILIDDWRLVLSRQWGFGEAEVLTALGQIGPHSTHFENGAYPADILVARYE